MHRWLLIACLCVGCGGRVTQDAAELSDGGVADTSSFSRADTAPSSADASSSTPDASSSPPDRPTDPTDMFRGCFGDIGEAAVSTVEPLVWTYASCDMSSCWTSLTITPDCKLSTGPFGGPPLRVATLSKADCEVMHRWVTSKRLIHALTSASPEITACHAAPAKEGFFEDTELGTDLWQKTFWCEVEPFLTQRMCLSRLWAKYFSGE